MMEGWPDRFGFDEPNEQRAKFMRDQLAKLGPPVFTTVVERRLVDVGRVSLLVISPDDLLRLINQQNINPTY